jgi:hypothetical protein
MPQLVPNRFLFRMAQQCPYVARMPLDPDDDFLLDLPESARLRTYAGLDDMLSSADVRLGWNETGLGVVAVVLGKEKEPLGDASKPRTSDGVTLWIDTRGDRTAHRASRSCHQFHLLPSGGGADKDQPEFVQSKLNRALQDAPIVEASAVPFRCHRLKKGYRVEAFLPASALTGYDPEQYRQLGVYYHVRDAELGDQYLGVNTDFPFADDPSLWDVLELLPK